ncbi:hypothetical protein DACRYDRAFT_108754 [Dacryopinax primogenitus]|uniref:Uncharacterized protein n=1 Tax=Dacryopinax primogenitus (strain DJM 731) TaxID=1858805 RepID=M5G4F5_DACPD|nr:uncharacterized protein DACRYDRAFT_108754 [Dacryopinax primogenitus]EJU00687.1 hypothetical protein DACRYDRAFT_108754 [Dacryopinax primogenitus]
MVQAAAIRKRSEDLIDIETFTESAAKAKITKIFRLVMSRSRLAVPGLHSLVGGVQGHPEPELLLHYPAWRE